jgi:ABC-type phosphate transport system substrate-binding protein
LTGLGSSQLELSTWTYCAIANGTIGYWDDAAITADNGGTPVAGHQPITFYYRSDGSGTTYLFEYKLNNSKEGCNQHWKGVYAKAPYNSSGRSAAWTAGLPGISSLLWTGPTGTQPSGSTFTGESGNPGIIEGIQGLLGSGYPYATGYAEGAWANAASNPSLGQAAVQSGGTFVSPTNPLAVSKSLAKATHIKYGVGADGISLGSPNPHCQLYIPPATFVNPPAGAYPIVGLSYWLFYGKNQTRNGSNHFTDLKNLITYLDSPAWNNALPGLEYAPLPSSTQTKVQAALNGHGKTAACFQT